VPGAEIHILEAGHFCLDEKAGEIIALTDAKMSIRRSAVPMFLWGRALGTGEVLFYENSQPAANLDQHPV
jgi:hypothetical protein